MDEPPARRPAARRGVARAERPGGYFRLAMTYCASAIRTAAAAFVMALPVCALTSEINEFSVEIALAG